MGVGIGGDMLFGFAVDDKFCFQSRTSNPVIFSAFNIIVPTLDRRKVAPHLVAMEQVLNDIDKGITRVTSDTVITKPLLGILIITEASKVHSLIKADRKVNAGIHKGVHTIRRIHAESDSKLCAMVFVGVILRNLQVNHVILAIDIDHNILHITVSKVRNGDGAIVDRPNIVHFGVKIDRRRGVGLRLTENNGVFHG